VRLWLVPTHCCLKYISTLPFGAQVSDTQGNELGIVGQAGQVLLSVALEPQRLHVRWGEHNDIRCHLWVDPQQLEQVQGYHVQTLTCLPPAEI